MKVRARMAVTALVAAGLAGGIALPAAGQVSTALEGRGASMAVWTGDAWYDFWNAGLAPTAWSAPDPVIADAVDWQLAGEGVDLAELKVAGGGLAWRVRVILLRLDPGRVRLDLHRATRKGGALGAWTVDSLPAHAVAGLNAGQFNGAFPWGWIVREGREVQAPRAAPLAMALVILRSGRAQLVQDDELEELRAGGEVALAFQSYPAVLVGDGDVPRQLREAGKGVDLEHRDTRLALGQLPDGRLLVALTRFGALGGALESLPFGPTTPEMAALMGALGCRRAVLLDGGLSAQLAVLTSPDAADGRRQTWPGIRRVPMGLVVLPRERQETSWAAQGPAPTR